MTNISITKDRIDKLIKESEIECIKMGEKTTVVKLTLPNGFSIVESSSCVDPDNYDEALGKKLCVEKITNKIWELEGYRLQCENPVKNNE